MLHLSWIPRSVMKRDYEKARQFITNLVDKFPIANDQINVGVIVYSNSPTTAISLKQCTNKAYYQPGATNTPAALVYALHLF